MILRRFTLFIALANIAATPALAEEKSSAPKDDDIICKFEKTMGSNIPKRVCMTRADREALHRENAEVMREKEQDRRTAGPNGSN